MINPVVMVTTVIKVIENARKILVYRWWRSYRFLAR